MKKNLLKKLAFLILMVLVTKAGFCQIQGSVKDEINEPISFATVILLNQSDSAQVTGVMATENGTFNITNFQPGNYIIAISMIGYEMAYSTPFEITSSNEHIHIDPIIVKQISQQLGDVNVVAEKPVYQMQSDRLVVNVENSETTTGTTALEVLERSPGVIVDRQNNTLSMNGKSGVSIIFNGKRTTVPLDVALETLKSMSSDNLSKIELITTPPARYDAEGDAGIINIVLKENDDFGTNGSFLLGAGIGRREKFNGGLNLNHHVGKVNIYGNYNALWDVSKHIAELSRTVNQSGSLLETNAHADRPAQTLTQNLRFGVDYTISSKTVLGFLGTGYVREWDMDAVNELTYIRDHMLIEKSTLETTELNKWISGTGNINMRHNFKEEEILDINLDYLNYYNDNPSQYKNNRDIIGSDPVVEQIDVTKETPINIYVATVDYSNQFNDDIKMETGLKFSLSKFKNDVGVSYLRQANWEEDPDLTNEYNLDEKINAAYVSFNFMVSEKININSGLRYEHLNTELNSETEKGILNLNYGKLFPTLYFSWSLNDDNSININYSKRITRPAFTDLAPFVLFFSPETFSSGNENLKPAISNILEFTYQYKRIILRTSYTHTKDDIATDQPKVDAEANKTIFQPRNIDKSQYGNVVLAFPVNLAQWWKMQYNIQGNYTKQVFGYDDQNLDIEQYRYAINMVQNFTISKSFSFETTGDYLSKISFGVNKLKARWRINLGGKYSFTENSQLTLNVSDAFHTWVPKWYSDVPELNIKSYNSYDFETRIVSLTFTQNFGNTKIKAARSRTTGSEEERSRIVN